MGWGAYGPGNRARRAAERRGRGPAYGVSHGREWARLVGRARRRATRRVCPHPRPSLARRGYGRGGVSAHARSTARRVRRPPRRGARWAPGGRGGGRSPFGAPAAGGVTCIWHGGRGAASGRRPRPTSSGLPDSGSQGRVHPGPPRRRQRSGPESRGPSWPRPPERTGPGRAAVGNLWRVGAQTARRRTRSDAGSDDPRATVERFSGPGDVFRWGGGCRILIPAPGVDHIPLGTRLNFLTKSWTHAGWGCM